MSSFRSLLIWSRTGSASSVEAQERVARRDAPWMAASMMHPRVLMLGQSAGLAVDDELNAPLGQVAVRSHFLSRGTAVAAAAMAGAALLAAAGAFRLQSAQPPTVRYAGHTPALSSAKPRETLAAMPERQSDVQAPQTAPGGKDAPPENGKTSGSDEPAGSKLAEMEQHTGVKIIRTGGGTGPEPLIINVAEALKANSFAASGSTHGQPPQARPAQRTGETGASGQVRAGPAAPIGRSAGAADCCTSRSELSRGEPKTAR